MDSFFITTPIYYVNARPHLGHAYSTIVADAIVRFNKINGIDAVFLTGTDEHGDKIVKSAHDQNIPLEDFVNSNSKTFTDLWSKLNTNHNFFVRTTSPEHKRYVQKILQRVYDSGDIYYGEFGGYYCYGCERFYTEKELENGLCPQHQSKPDFIKEKNYFFRMSKYLPWLYEYIKNNEDFIRPERYKLEVLAMLEGGVLDDLCISRPKKRLEWGIELPFDPNYVCYVWFDALLSYISPLYAGMNHNLTHYWPGEHIIGKDILKPHAIFWTTMLKSAQLPIFKHLNVHGYWLSRNTKMSKSLGNVIDPVQLVSRFGVDAFRYFLLREMHFGSDASFSEDALIKRINSDLANDLGNLFNRVLSMNSKYFGALIPRPSFSSPDDLSIIDFAATQLEKYIEKFQKMEISQGIEALWEIVRMLNKYIDTQAPWTLYKAGNMERLSTVMNLLLEYMYKIACCLWPIMPEAASNLVSQLGQKHIFSNEISPNYTLLDILKKTNLKIGGEIAHTSNLFPRIFEQEKKIGKIQQTDSKNSVSQLKQSKHADQHCNEIEFEHFSLLDIKVGTVVSAQKHPNADKLIQLEIDFGEEKLRQIISGIGEYYKPENLPGKQVCGVLNLKPRKIRGIFSYGMLLTSFDINKISLLTVDDVVVNGSKIS